MDLSMQSDQRGLGSIEYQYSMKVWKQKQKKAQGMLAVVLSLLLPWSKSCSCTTTQSGYCDREIYEYMKASCFLKCLE